MMLRERIRAGLTAVRAFARGLAAYNRHTATELQRLCTTPIHPDLWALAQTISLESVFSTVDVYQALELHRSAGRPDVTAEQFHAATNRLFHLGVPSVSRVLDEACRMIEVWQRDYDSACAREDEERARADRLAEALREVKAYLLRVGNREQPVAEALDTIEEATALADTPEPPTGEGEPCLMCQYLADTLQGYADPASWQDVDRHDHGCTESPARRDKGRRARAALSVFSRDAPTPCPKCEETKRALQAWTKWRLEKRVIEDGSIHIHPTEEVLLDLTSAALTDTPEHAASLAVEGADVVLTVTGPVQPPCPKCAAAEARAEEHKADFWRRHQEAMEAEARVEEAERRAIFQADVRGAIDEQLHEARSQRDRLAEALEKIEKAAQPAMTRGSHGLIRDIAHAALTDTPEPKQPKVPHPLDGANNITEERLAALERTLGVRQGRDTNSEGADDAG
jgi:hypothetical protein